MVTGERNVQVLKHTGRRKGGGEGEGGGGEGEGGGGGGGGGGKGWVMMIRLS